MAKSSSKRFSKTKNPKPMPGYPAKAFSRMEDIRSYLDGDKIICLFCGREYTSLGGHIGRIHGMSSDEYRVHFGIPFRYGLAAKPFRQRASRHLRKLRKEGKVSHSPSAATIAKMLRARKNRRPLAAAVQRENQKKLLRLHGRKEVWRKADYEEFFRRVKSGRAPYEVGRDRDMPSKGAFLAHLKRAPSLRKKYHELWEKLPFSIQARANKSGERYKRTLVNLRRRGKTWPQVAELMGVKVSAVRGMWHVLKQSGKIRKYR